MLRDGLEGCGRAKEEVSLSVLCDILCVSAWMFVEEVADREMDSWLGAGWRDSDWETIDERNIARERARMSAMGILDRVIESEPWGGWREAMVRLWVRLWVKGTKGLD